MKKSIEIFQSIEKSTIKNLGLNFSYFELQNSTAFDFENEEFYKKYYGNEEFPDEYQNYLRRSEMLHKKYPSPSKYQDKGSYGILLLSEDILRSHLQKKNIVLPQSTLGTLPIGVLNGYTIKANNNDYLIIFQDGLFHYLNLLTKVILQALPQSHEGVGMGIIYTGRILREFPEVQFRFEDLFEGYLIYGNPRYALPYYKNIPDPRYFQNLLTNAEVFLLAHEYSHVLLGHLDAPPDNREKFFDNEFDADKKGFELLSKIIPKENTKGYALLSIGMMFYGLNLIEHSISVLIYGEEAIEGFAQGDSRFRIYKSYPSFIERADALQKAFYKKEDSSYSIYKPLLIDICNALNLLWRNFLPKLIDYHKKGIKPHISLLPNEYRNMGNKSSKKISDFWIEKVMKGVLSDNKLKKFYLGYLDRYTIEAPFVAYKGLLSEEEEFKNLCKEFLTKLEPMYESYFPGLMEKFKTKTEEGNLNEYILNISIYLMAKVGIFIQQELEK
jgi:hypothetical protein